MNKVCRRCKLDLPLDMYYRRADSPDGKQYVCKQCSVQILIDWGNRNPEKKKARLKAAHERDKASGYVRQKEWNRNNPQKKRNQVRRYSLLHPDRVKARYKAWSSKNSESIKSKKALYKKLHPDKVRVWQFRRRANKHSASGNATLEQIQARVDYYGGKCYLCGKPYNHIDHVIPLSRGGSNWPANLRPACSECNLKKNDKLLSEVL